MLRGAGQSELPLLNISRRPEAAHAQGEFQKRDEYLQKLKVDPQAQLAIQLSTSPPAARSGNGNKAVICWNSYASAGHQHPQILQRLRAVYQAQHAWQAERNYCRHCVNKNLLNDSDYSTTNTCNAIRRSLARYYKSRMKRHCWHSGSNNRAPFGIHQLTTAAD